MGGLWLFFSLWVIATNEPLSCKDRGHYYEYAITQNQLRTTAASVFTKLLQSKKILIAQHQGPVRLWSELKFRAGDEEDAKSIDPRYLLFGMGLTEKSEIFGYRKIEEDCLWPMARASLSAPESAFLKSTRVYELNEIQSIAFVPIVLAEGAVLSIPLGNVEDPSNDLSTMNFLYIQNGGLFQREFLQQSFGATNLFFSSQSPTLEDPLVRFAVHLEEIYHILDHHLRFPELNSEIYSDIENAERSLMPPNQPEMERSFEDFKSSLDYEQAFLTELEKYKAETPLPQLYGQLIPIWTKAIHSRLEREFYEQAHFYKSYLLKYHEFIAKWRVMQTLKMNGFTEEEAVDLMQRESAEHSFFTEWIHSYFQNLYRLESLPARRSQKLMREISRFAWPETFRQIVARLTIAQPEIPSLSEIYQEFNSRELWSLDYKEQIYQVYIRLQESLPNDGRKKWTGPQRWTTPYIDPKTYH